MISGYLIIEFQRKSFLIGELSNRWSTVTADWYAVLSQAELIVQHPNDFHVIAIVSH